MGNYWSWIDVSAPVQILMSLKPVAAGGSAPTYDNASSKASVGVNTDTLSHTCGATGTDGIVLVFICQGQSGTPIAINTITYNGVTMTNIGSFASTDGNFCHVDGWYALAPATGAHDVVWTTVASASITQVATGAISLTGVNQSTPFGTPATNNGATAGPATVTISSSSSELVLTATMTDATTVTATTGTARWTQNNISSDTSASGSTTTGAASVSPAWTLGGSVDNGWTISAVGVKGV